MINNNTDALTIIRALILNIIPDSRILLFGSRARKDHTSDSDYDILVITKTTIEIRAKRTLQSQIRKELAKYKIPADIIIQSDAEILSKGKIPGHILKQALQEGVVI